MPRPTNSQPPLSKLERKHIELAVQARLIPQNKWRRDTGDLPDNLQPDLTLAACEMIRTGSAYFREQFEAGVPVFHVILCRPESRCGRGELTPELVKAEKDWIEGRLRRVSNPYQPRGRRRPVKAYQQRLLGTFDLSWNDKRYTGQQRSLWDPHTHAFGTVEEATAGGAKKLLNKALSFKGDDLTGREIVIKQIKTFEHFKNVAAYLQGNIQIYDPTDKGHDRRARMKVFGSKYTRKRPLPWRRKAEFTRLMAATGPEKFLVMSGFRRRGNRIELENATNVRKTRKASAKPPAPAQATRPRRATLRRAAKLSESGILRAQLVRKRRQRNTRCSKGSYNAQ